jgi:hypothetical protein
MAQAGREGEGFPMPVRCVSDQSHAARAATSQPRHIGAGGRHRLRQAAQD